MNEIILLGPVAVGKTTTAKLLSQKLNLPKVSIDDLRFDYYKEIGYSDEHMNLILEKAGIFAIYQYGKIFDTYSIERTLEDHQHCVFDFGGGNNGMGFNFEYERYKKALEPYKNVVLLYPCPNKAEALEFVFARREVQASHQEFIKHLVYDDSNFKLAKHIVYVKDKSPKEVCAEVLALTNSL